MTRTALPQTGGSFIRDEKSGLTKVAGTQPIVAKAKTKPKAKPAEKEAK